MNKRINSKGRSSSCLANGWTNPLHFHRGFMRWESYNTNPSASAQRRKKACHLDGSPRKQRRVEGRGGVWRRSRRSRDWIHFRDIATESPCPGHHHSRPWPQREEDFSHAVLFGIAKNPSLWNVEVLSHSPLSHSPLLSPLPLSSLSPSPPPQIHLFSSLIRISASHSSVLRQKTIFSVSDLLGTSRTCFLQPDIRFLSQSQWMQGEKKESGEVQREKVDFSSTILVPKCAFTPRYHHSVESQLLHKTTDHLYSWQVFLFPPFILSRTHTLNVHTHSHCHISL